MKSNTSDNETADIASVMLWAACVLRKTLNKNCKILNLKKRIYNQVETSAAGLGTCDIVRRLADLQRTIDDVV